MKASFSSFSQNSKGRLHNQDNFDDRDAFARDRDRVIHSMAFRRLKGKTQVFISTGEDHMRTRLTHTIEVAQIARTLARFLKVDEDLTETIALSHDLGHPPYGHIGEDALNASMTAVGGFDHNAHSLKIVTEIEHKYPEFNGLNLTWESLEGIIKHNGPVDVKDSSYIATYNKKSGLEKDSLKKDSLKKDSLKKDSLKPQLLENWDLQLDTFSSVEAQIAAIADDVAYNHHDIDDGYRAGLFTLQDLKTVKHIKPVIETVKKQYPDISENRQVTEIVRRLLSQMVMDIKDTTQGNLNALNPTSVDDVRNAGYQIVCMSDAMYNGTKELREFLFTRVYRAESIENQRKQCWDKITALYEYYTSTPSALPQEWQRDYMHINSDGAITSDTVATGVSIGDYIAGMTDSYADRVYADIPKD